MAIPTSVSLKSRPSAQRLLLLEDKPEHIWFAAPPAHAATMADLHNFFCNQPASVTSECSRQLL